MQKLNEEKIKEILEDKESVGKILRIINLNQEERIMDYNRTILHGELARLRAELTTKHKLEFLDISMLIIVLQAKEHKSLINKLKREWGKRYAKKRKRKDL